MSNNKRNFRFPIVKPKVTCSKTEAMSKEEEEVQFVCTIHSNPSSVISWTNQKGIILGDKYSRYTMKKEVFNRY